MTWAWLLVPIGIIGVILNNHRRIECFYLWGVTSLAWAFIDYQKGIYPQAVLFLIYFGLAIHGYVSWKRKEVKNKEDTP